MLPLWWYPVSTKGDLPGIAGVSADDTVVQATVQAIVDGVAPARVMADDRQYVRLTNKQNTVRFASCYRQIA